MKVSIIIPTKNRWNLLKETLDNILNQSLSAHEIIVIDDGSSDKTEENIKKLYKEKVIIRRNKGAGPGAARNLGLEIATGDYIKFFDSDDLMTKNTIEVQLKLLQSSDKGFIYSPYFYAKTLNDSWKVMENVVLQYHPFFALKPLTNFMCKGLFIPIPSMMFKKDLLVEVGKWRTDVTAYEDWDYLWRIGAIEPYPLHTNECSFLYRIHGNQTTENNFSNEQRDQDKILVFETILEKLLPKAFSSWDLMNLKMRIYPELAKYKPEGTNSQFYKYHFTKNILRLQDKLGRIKTQTNWQPHHSPIVNINVINYYLSLIA